MHIKHIKKAKIAIVLFFYIFAFCQNTFSKITTKVDISVVHLSNGLTITFASLPGQNAISLRIIVKSGGTAQPYDKGGVAHYVEHLMFKVSKYEKISNEFHKTSPAYQNAYTGYDRTVYVYDRIPKEKLIDILTMESIRFHGLDVEEKAAKNELSVVLEEDSMIRKTPKSNAIFEAITILFRGGKYALPISGGKSLTLKDAQDFYAKNYVPSNMSIVIVGDVDKDKTITAIEKLFGDISSSQQHLVAKEAKPLENGKKYYLQFTNKQPSTTVACIWRNGPSLLSSIDEFLAFNIVSHTLNGNNGALYKHFVQDKKLVNQISIDVLGVSGEYICPNITAELKEGVDVYIFEKELDEFLQKLSENGISQEQLSISQKGVYYDFVYQLEEPSAIATDITDLIICECAPEKYNDYISILDSLTVRYINKVFRKYLAKSPDMVLAIKGE